MKEQNAFHGVAKASKALSHLEPAIMPQHPDARELNKAPFKEEVEALRVTLNREERLMEVLAGEISRVKIEHDIASHALAQAQAVLDAASVIYQTSDTMLQGLQSQHDQLMRNVAEKKAALHPIRRVPAELWKDIFTFWANDEEYERVQRLDSQLPMEHKTPASLLIAAVSHFWRKTALSTPTLWQYIEIPNRTSFAEIKLHLQEWTRRSAPRIVSLSLWNVGRESWSKEQTIPASLDGLRLALSLLRDRIGRLEVHFQRSNSVVGIFSSIISDSRVKLSALAEIWIEFIDPPEVTIVIPERTFQLHRLKMLHRLTLRNLWWTSRDGLKSLRVLKIESLTTPTDINPFRHLLTNARELEEVEFLTISSDTHPNIPQGAVVDHPRLKTLTLCPRWLSFCQEDLAQVMTLPGLRTLRLVACQVAPLTARESDCVERFISQVAPAVETLYFNLCGELFHPQILQCRAGISRLEFFDTEISLDTINLLSKPVDVASTASSRWLMPHLISLHFEDCDLPQDMDKPLAHLVEVRAEATAYINAKLNAKLKVTRRGSIS